MANNAVSCVVCQNAATVYCDNDQAFLCKDCDCKIHTSNTVASRHNRLRVCELCNKQASTVYCKNDRAYLCDDCDSEIHLNNPLAARHEIVPVSKYAQELQGNKPEPVTDSGARSETSAVRTGAEDLSRSVPKVPPAVDLPSNKPVAKEQMKSFWGKEFELFDLDNAWLDRLDMGFDIPDILDSPGDGLVPTLSDATEGTGDNVAVVPQLSAPPATPNSHLVPQANTCASLPTQVPSLIPPPVQLVPTQQHVMPTTGVAQPPQDQNFSVPPGLLHVGGQAPMNRAERVMRYREKRKLRKFEKTIRYASRKAYAEVRPRIKGRFAKREEMLAWQAGLLDPNHPLSLAMAESGALDFDALLVPDLMSA